MAIPYPEFWGNHPGVTHTAPDGGLIPGVYVYTAPGSFLIEGAGWEHPSLNVWQNAVVLWDRDCPELIVNSIHVYNGERGNLWVGTEPFPRWLPMFKTPNGTTSSVVLWCRECVRWEPICSERDHRGIDRHVKLLGSG